MNHLPLHRSCSALIGWLALAAVACKDPQPSPGERSHGQPPPPAPSSSGSSICLAGSPESAEAKQALPMTVGSFCMSSQPLVFGGQGKPIGGIRDLFDGGASAYLDAKVEQLIEARYQLGKNATIEVLVSRFSSDDAAFAMFTGRVVNDQDPANPDAPHPLDPTKPGIALDAIGGGAASAAMGKYFVEANYQDVTLSPADLEKSSEKPLADFLSAISTKLSGSGLSSSGKPPAAALRLPVADRIPLGIRYFDADFLGVHGAAGATGYYRTKEGARYRVATLVAKDDAAATAALKALSAGAKPLGGLGDEAFEDLHDAKLTGWILVRSQSSLIGIGDEPLAKKTSLPRDAKLELLKAALSGPK